MFGLGRLSPMAALLLLKTKACNIGENRKKIRID